MEYSIYIIEDDDEGGENRIINNKYITTQRTHNEHPPYPQVNTHTHPPPTLPDF